MLILGQVDVEASPQNCFNQLVMESTDQVPGYIALILTPAYQFFAGYRELLVTEKPQFYITVNYWLQRPGTGQSCLRQFLVTENY